MESDSKIPDGWAMPDDLSKKINEKLNKKTLRLDALEEMAWDIALIEPDLRD